MNRENWNGLDELLREMGVRDTLFGHLEMCRILEQQGIEPTEENIDRFFPFRNIGCPGLVCPHCESIRLWIVKRKKADIFCRIDVTVFECIDCDEESSFHYDSYNGCYEDPDRREAWMEDQAAECHAESNIPEGFD